MNAKDFVLQHKPTARSERQKSNGGKVYFLIREKGAYMYLASGDTEYKAWVATKEIIISKNKS